MTKERDSKMLKLVTSNETEINTSEVKLPEVENKVYQSDPIKTNLYAKLLAFRQSQKKFNVQDLIRDSLK